MRRFFAVVLFSLIAGCSTIGQQKAVTPEDNLRYGQAVMTGIYTTLGNAAEQKTIPAADARAYYDRLNDPKQALDSADAALRLSGGVMPPDAIGKVNLAVGILTGIAAELRARLPAAQTVAIPAPQ